jgi:hypothetical protein
LRPGSLFMWPACQSAKENASMQGKDFEKTNLHNVNIIFFLKERMFHRDFPLWVAIKLLHVFASHCLLAWKGKTTFCWRWHWLLWIEWAERCRGAVSGATCCICSSGPVAFSLDLLVNRLTPHLLAAHRSEDPWQHRRHYRRQGLVSQLIRLAVLHLSILLWILKNHLTAPVTGSLLPPIYHPQY